MPAGPAPIPALAHARARHGGEPGGRSWPERRRRAALASHYKLVVEKRAAEEPAAGGRG